MDQPKGSVMSAEMDSDMNSDMNSMGPVDYLVVEFPDARVTGDALPRLVDLVDRGVVRILDLVFLRKRPTVP
jgi:hypothetical protein